MTDDGRLGGCPRCGTVVTGAEVLIAYETNAGGRVYAECPDCHHIAHPVAEE